MDLHALLQTKAGQNPVNRERLAAAARSLGAVTPRQREQVSVSALDRTTPPRHGRKKCVGYVLTLTSFRKRLIDDDNLIAGAKSLRDSISTSIGCDDADPRLKWEYRQQQTDGAEGTLVTISRVCLKAARKRSGR